ncbi:MAG: hypothetical protein KIT84_28010 [Labilithrix sp.]|nr:hypothetical protein [Labilithrix sp.]MCW5814904.1 hypothetical protein [Labilithrix sp.]
MRSHDTSLDAYELQLRGYRQMSPARKSELVAELSETVRELAREGIRQRHPDYDTADVDRALVALVYGPEVARRVFPGTTVTPA